MGEWFVEVEEFGERTAAKVGAEYQLNKVSPDVRHSLLIARTRV